MPFTIQKTSRCSLKKKKLYSSEMRSKTKTRIKFIRQDCATENANAKLHLWMSIINVHKTAHKTRRKMGDAKNSNNKEVNKHSDRN